MKKKILALVGIVLIVSFNSFALAEDQIDNVNSNTGADSTNQNVTNTTPESEIDINNENSQTGEGSENQNIQNINQSDVSGETTTTTIINESNTTNLGIDTGSNQVEHSSLIENFETGDISGQITAVKNEGNTLADGSQVGVKTSSSDNQVDETDWNTMDSLFDLSSGQTSPPASSNQFYVLSSEDEMNLDLNTGLNDFERNTIINAVQTGNIDFATNLLNLFAVEDPELLLNLQVYSILGDLTGNIVIEDSFLNEDPLMQAFSGGASTSTETTIDNNTNFIMNTGENNLENNTVAGDISSGDAAAGYFQNDFAGLLTKTNFFIVNVLGDWIGENFLAGYDNVAVNILSPSAQEYPIIECLDQEKHVSIDIDSTLTANANTGRNNFRQNTVVGSVKTGHINLLENVVNLKSTLVALKKKLNIRIINILGNFRGSVVVAAKPEVPVPTVTPGPAVGGGTVSESPNPSAPPDSTESTPDVANQVLGVSQVVQLSQAETSTIPAASSQVQNPGLIEAGTNLTYLLYLLLLFPALTIIRLSKKV